MNIVATAGSNEGGGFGAKLREALGQATDSPRKTRGVNRRKVTIVPSNLTWYDPDFGALQITTPGFSMGESEGNGPNHWTRVFYGNQMPAKIELNFEVKFGEGVRVLQARGGQVTEVTDTIPALVVDVEWRDQDKPHTRKRDADNVDFVFLRPDGDFLQVQVSLSSRAGRLWVGAQQIWHGQIVRTSHAKAATLGVTIHKAGSHAAFVVPLAREHAYPGADYLRTFKNMGPKVIDFAIGHDAVAPLSNCVVADDWSPVEVDLPAKMLTNGWKPAAVTYFNLVTGVGFAICPDGKPCFIHFTAIVDDNGRPVSSRDQFPVLEPMHEVALRWKMDGDIRKATAVRVI